MENEGQELDEKLKNMSEEDLYIYNNARSMHIIKGGWLHKKAPTLHGKTEEIGHSINGNNYFFTFNRVKIRVDKLIFFIHHGYVYRHLHHINGDPEDMDIKNLATSIHTVTGRIRSNCNKVKRCTYTGDFNNLKGLFETVAYRSVIGKIKRRTTDWTKGDLSIGYKDSGGTMVFRFGDYIISVARLTYFMEHGEVKKFVRHTDGNKLNNHISNLYTTDKDLRGRPKREI